MEPLWVASKTMKNGLFADVQSKFSILRWRERVAGWPALGTHLLFLLCKRRRGAQDCQVAMRVVSGACHAERLHPGGSTRRFQNSPRSRWQRWTTPRRRYGQSGKSPITGTRMRLTPSRAGRTRAKSRCVRRCHRWQDTVAGSKAEPVSICQT